MFCIHAPRQTLGVAPNHEALLTVGRAQSRQKILKYTVVQKLRSTVAGLAAAQQRFSR